MLTAQIDAEGSESGASSMLCQASNIANMLRKVSELKIALWG